MPKVPDLIIHEAEQSGTPIVTGCPFPADCVPGAGLAIELADGRRVPAQAAELIPRTPRGVTWLELSFISPVCGPAGVRAVAVREGERDLAAVGPAGAVLDNARVRVELSADAARPPLAVTWCGGAGALAPEMVVSGSLVREPAGARRTVRVVRNGPIRCRVELAGRLAAGDGSPSFGYRLVVEMWKDRPALRIDWMLAHEVPGVPEFDVTRAALVGEWQVGAAAERVFRQPCHTNEYVPRLVRNPDPVTIVADDEAWGAHVADAAMLLDSSDYSFYCRPGIGTVPPWLQLQGASGAVCATVVDFAETRPNAIESAGSCLSYAMVPGGAGLRWPQGRRKEQTLLLAFAAAEPGLKPEALVQEAQAVFAAGRAQPSPAVLAGLACFDQHRVLPFEPGLHLRVNNLLDSYCALNTAFSKWDLGDTPNWHYTLGYAAALDGYHPLPGACPPPKRFAGGGSGSAFLHEGVAMFLEPVWTNNEYDMIHALAAETMRTGRPNHLDMLRRAARHNIEIDFVAYSDDAAHHRASPFHSRHHNTKGAITSHFWTQGLLEYYCLTGDDDAREVALALGDKIVELNHTGVRAAWKFDREIGWALLALVCLLDAGFDRFRGEADVIADFLTTYDRQGFSGAVNLSGGRRGRSLERQMIDCGFGYTPMVEALDLYHGLSPRAEMGAWLAELLVRLKAEFWNKVQDGEIPTAHNMIGLVMEIGYARTGDPDFLVAGELVVEHYLDPAFPLKHPMGGELGQSKPCAVSHRAFCRLFAALARAGRLAQFEYPAVLQHGERAGARGGAGRTRKGRRPGGAPQRTTKERSP